MAILSKRSSVALLLSDILIVWAGLVISAYLRATIELGAFIPDYALGTPPLLYALAPPLWVFGLRQAHAGTELHGLSLVSTFRRVLFGHALATLLFWGFLYISLRDYSRLQSIYFIASVGIAFLAQRLLLLSFVRPPVQRVLVVGINSSSQQLGQEILNRRSLGLQLVGFVSSKFDDESSPNAHRVPIIGSIDQLSSLVQQEHVHEIIVALKWFNGEQAHEIAALLRGVHHLPVNVRLAPDYSDLAYFQVSTATLGGIALIGLREPIFSPTQRLIKRLLDILLSAIALMIFAPFFVVIAALVRLDSPGPILLRQQRLGQHKRLFTMYKFRTMYINADYPPPATWIKSPDDPRITRIGRWLRRTSLDELPQFYNVLIGDMSLVGPRPEMPIMVEKYDWWQEKRFEVPQGLTGWWQVNGRADRPMHLHVNDDLFYIRNYSLWLDMSILIRTIIVVVAGRGAF